VQRGFTRLSLIYACDSRLTEIALEKLKADGLVSQDAYFSLLAPGNLRWEAACRGFDFASRLSREAEGEIVSSVPGWLKQKNIVSDRVIFEGEVVHRAAALENVWGYDKFSGIGYRFKRI
jgi:hypothetical protein